MPPSHVLLKAIGGYGCPAQDVSITRREVEMTLWPAASRRKPLMNSPLMRDLVGDVSA